MKTNTQIITETLGTTLIDYYAELKIEFDRKLPYNDTIGEIEAKIQAHKQARREIIDFINNQSEKGNLINEKGFSAGICLSDLRKAIEFELAYEGNLKTSENKEEKYNVDFCGDGR